MSEIEQALETAAVAVAKHADHATVIDEDGKVVCECEYQPPDVELDMTPEQEAQAEALRISSAKASVLEMAIGVVQEHLESGHAIVMPGTKPGTTVVVCTVETFKNLAADLRSRTNAPVQEA